MPKINLFIAAIAALYLGSSLTDWLTHSLTHWLGPCAELGQSYTTKGRPHIETWGLSNDIRDINDNDNNDDDDDDNKDDNDNNKVNNDNKGNSAVGLDRSQGFLQGQWKQWQEEEQQQWSCKYLSSGTT